MSTAPAVTLIVLLGAAVAGLGYAMTRPAQPLRPRRVDRARRQWAELRP